MADPSARTPGQRFRNPAAMSPSSKAPQDEQVTVSEQPAPVVLQRYQKTSRTMVWLVAGILVGLVAALIYLGTKPDSNDPTVSPNGQTPTPSATHTPPPSGLGVEFNSRRDDAIGYWEILDWEWDNDGVLITMRLTLDEGDSMDFEWFAFDNAEVEEWYPEDARSTIAYGTLTNAEPVTGTVYFRMPREELTVYLCSSSGHNITGLVIPG